MLGVSTNAIASKQPIFQVVLLQSFHEYTTTQYYFCKHFNDTMWQMLGLFPSSNAIATGDKEYHSAVNIGASMKARYNNWRHQGW